MGSNPHVHFVFSTPDHFVMHFSGWTPPSHHPLHLKCSFRHQLFQTLFLTNTSHGIKLLVLYYHILWAYPITLLIILLSDYFFFYCIFHHCTFLLQKNPWLYCSYLCLIFRSPFSALFYLIISMQDPLSSLSSNPSILYTGNHFFWPLPLSLNYTHLSRLKS